MLIWCEFRGDYMVPKAKCLIALSQVQVVFLIALAILAGCSRSQPENPSKVPTDAVLLTGAGATFSSVLYNRWLVVYHNNNPKVVIKYASVGSSEGVRRFIGKNVAEEEKVDFGASDAAMSDTEVASADNNVLMIP